LGKGVGKVGSSITRLGRCFSGDEKRFGFLEKVKLRNDHQVDYIIFAIPNSLVNYSRTDDHAVPIYKNSEPLSITFKVSKYPQETLGQLLRKLRLKKGLEQWELARKLRVNRNSVCEWEKDRKRPSRESMEKLAKFFRIGRKTLEDLKIEINEAF
jgi:DNA-binding XRE family transcriptional regulator